MHAVDVLMYAHRTVEAALEGLPDETWETPGVCGVWSLKSIVAHLASYEHLLVDVVMSLTQSSPTLTLQRYLASQEFNDQEVNRRSALTARQTWDEYASAHTHTLELLATLSSDKLHHVGLLPWYGEQYDLEDFIVYSYYGHKREHAAQIMVYKDHLAGRGYASFTSVGTELG